MTADDVPGVAGLRPYENFGDLTPETAQAAADIVLEEGWTPNPRYPRLRLDAPVDWSEGTPAERSWRFNIQCLDMVNELLLAHSATGDAGYLRPAVAVVLDWVASHEGPGRDASTFAWYDMAVGLRAPRLAYVLDAAQRQALLEPGEIDALRQAIAWHRDALADDEAIAFHNNHGFYQIAGQLAMARRWSGRIDGMDAAAEQAMDRLRRMLGEQFTDEGVHREHSPDYHRMVCDSLAGVLRAGLVDEPAVISLADRIEDALAWFVQPDGILVNFGDSDARTMTRTRDEVLRKWRRSAMRCAASEGRVGEAPDADQAVFRDGGYFIARCGGYGAPTAGYLALSAAFHSRTHKHADDLSFVWFDRGSELIVDAGRYGYIGRTETGSDAWENGFWYADPRRQYVESTRAHNTVEIDGRDFIRRGARAYGSGIERCGRIDDIHYAEAEVRQFGTIRHARVLAWRPGEWLLVYDWLHDNTQASHGWRQWFHLAPSLMAHREAEQVTAMGAKLDKPMRVASLLGPPTLGAFILGQTQPRLQGFYSPREKVLIPNYALAFALDDTPSAGFATLFAFGDALEPDPENSEMATSGRAARLRWRLDGRRHGLVLRRPVDGAIEIEYSP